MDGGGRFVRPVNDALLENAPVQGSAGLERLLADIRESEEFADKALASREPSDFHNHTAFAALLPTPIGENTGVTVAA
jgi:hypothetical protein